MIVCRKPCVIYDVDVIAITALAAIGLAACFGVVIPATADASQYQELTARITAAKARTDAVNDHVQEVANTIGVLERGVDDRTRAAPKPGALTEFLRRVANLAQLSGLQIVQVVPQPTQRADGYRFATIRYTAHGNSRDFARFVDHLARDNPYFVLREFSIQAGPAADGSRCQLVWTLQLYMLDLEQAGGQG